MGCAVGCSPLLFNKNLLRRNLFSIAVLILMSIRCLNM